VRPLREQYGANGSNNNDRKCPDCQGGRPWTRHRIAKTAFRARDARPQERTGTSASLKTALSLRWNYSTTASDCCSARSSETKHLAARFDCCDPLPPLGCLLAVPCSDLGDEHRCVVGVVARYEPQCGVEVVDTSNARACALNDVVESVTEHWIFVAPELHADPQRPVVAHIRGEAGNDPVRLDQLDGCREPVDEARTRGFSSLELDEPLSVARDPFDKRLLDPGANLLAR